MTYPGMRVHVGRILPIRSLKHQLMDFLFDIEPHSKEIRNPHVRWRFSIIEERKSSNVGRDAVQALC